MRTFISAITTLSVFSCADINAEAQPPALTLKVEQLTSGTRHHFFGYIGQCQTIPWNAGGRYILCLQIDRINRMPLPGEAATVCVIDTKQDNRVIALDETRGWNPQQGTMFYWHPRQAETQFFFNDRDPETGRVFTVLYDLRNKKRLREYRYKDTPIGNGGVSADGTFFMGLNYGRLARLRPVTGYPNALDWSKGEIAPANDAILVPGLAENKTRQIFLIRVEQAP